MEHSVEELLTMMDEMNVGVIVDLDGMENKEMLITHIERFKAKAPDRFYHMGGIDWSKWEEKGSKFGDWAAKQVEEQVKLGASGIKIWKNLGLHIKDPQGNLVKVDDPRLDPIFETAASLKIPVYMHISDPVAFFDPVDQFNERIDDLGEHPEWSFFGPQFPSFLEVIEQFANRIRRHKKTQFIGCHVASYAENLTWVSSLLDECPNLCVDISERIGELGRQPYTTRKFFIQYADRIIFGIDRLPDKVWYQIYARFLETDDEYFNYDPTYPPRQGRWFIYGIYLPDEVLGKVYYKNLSRILRINKQ
ncbi:MAG: Amidohydrolase [Candidatus Atribacteria bacterium ADurb.Bin276]|jgi:predicted TIM-barrel fold metal-dependent hydrolase|uniref:Amidohydrolase n=2 Tax=Atribacter TaxID=2847777 RepID=A0A1V5SRI4_9BACT|nr:MAG: Amidohydrolase [Candidatus Atribacteria bacterium ADurb.Bin276]